MRIGVIGNLGQPEGRICTAKIGMREENGYIGMHSWDKFKETTLQDGEAAARLLANYAIPREKPIVKNFIKALRSDTVLEEEFSYYNPEKARFKNRFLGLRNGGGLMVLVNTCQALLVY